MPRGREGKGSLIVWGGGGLPKQEAPSYAANPLTTLKTFLDSDLLKCS